MIQLEFVNLRCLVHEFLSTEDCPLVCCINALPFAFTVMPDYGSGVILVTKDQKLNLIERSALYGPVRWMP